MPRGIDHLVIAVRELDRARAAYERLGFTLTPEARHPFGTKNSLIQLEASFLELVAVGDPAAIPEATPERFSFAAFNRDYLARREGLSMLALKSRDANIDHADFATRGLQVYEPIPFERIARGPDGEERKVAFTMNFTSDARIEDAGFFTCQHHFPANFWRREYQGHPNGARSIGCAIMVAPDPAAIAEFLTSFAGAKANLLTGLGVDIDTGDGRIEVLSPAGARALLGSALALEPDPKPRFIASRIGIGSHLATSKLFRQRGIPFLERGGWLVVPAGEACGVAIVFDESSFPPRSV